VIPQNARLWPWKIATAVAGSSTTTRRVVPNLRPKFPGATRAGTLASTSADYE
jgi:hypothetical protein